MSRSFSFFEILIFWVVRGEGGRNEGLVKEQKIVQNEKKLKILSVALHISGTIHHMIFIYGTHV